MLRPRTRGTGALDGQDAGDDRAPPAYARNRERFAKQGLVVGQAAQPLFAWSTLPVEKAKREAAAQRRPARSEWKKRLFPLANDLWTATGR